MLRCLRYPSGSNGQTSSISRAWPVACIALLASVGGCSADVTRFSGNALGANKTTTGSIGPGYETSSSLSDQTPSGDYSGSSVALPSSRVTTSSLPLAGNEPRRTGQTSSPRVLNTGTPRRPYQRVADASPFSENRTTLTDAGTSAGTIIVRQGDTLYAIARRNNVSITALKRANGLSSDMIQPGQALSLPGAANAITGAPSRRVPVRTTRPTYERSNTGTGLTSYTVQPGDSLYRISRQTGVPVADLKSINGITNVRSLRPGQVLALQSTGTASTSADRYTAPQRTLPSARPVTSQPVSVPPLVNAPRAGDRYALANPRPKAPTTRAATSGFRWPARGRILHGFGPRPDGSHNDGIDIDVPLGADVRAAQGGVVAYANSELEAYGNLILIRHDNGWVSAYAHADRLLVQRGDKVQRGQVIAKAGKTGAVDRPTLHFELRDGSKPVDPLPLLPRG